MLWLQFCLFLVLRWLKISKIGQLVVGKVLESHKVLVREQLFEIHSGLFQAKKIGFKKPQKIQKLSIVLGTLILALIEQLYH